MYESLESTDALTADPVRGVPPVHTHPGQGALLSVFLQAGAADGIVTHVADVEVTALEEILVRDDRVTVLKMTERQTADSETPHPAHRQ